MDTFPRDEGADTVAGDLEHHFRTFVENSILGVYRTTPDGRVLLANPALARMLGFPSVEALVASGMEQWAAGTKYPRTRFKQALALDGQVDGFQSTFLRADGSVVHLRESARAVRDRTGAIEYIEGFVEDLTKQKDLEWQLQQAQRLEALGRLAGGVAHDFNNILQAMMSQAQLMRIRPQVPARIEEAVSELEQEIRRGASLTRQLLLFSRREAVKPERLELNGVVQTAMRMLRRLVREEIVIREDLAADPLPVDGDRGQLEQVLVNLVINAADAMREGGTLTIRTAWIDCRYISLAVQDTGTGIPDDIRDHIFEPFFTTKGEGRGTGLGLSVVHGIVTRHGGSIAVESVEGQGTTFTVILPRAGSGEFPAVKDVAETDHPDDRGHGERVLVVEDEHTTRTGLHESLTALGYDVVSVASGEEAGLLPADPPFALLLTDLMLPGIRGAQLAAGLRDRWPNLKVVLMSGYTDDDALRREVEACGVRFLQKPFEIGALARELRAALRD